MATQATTTGNGEEIIRFKDAIGRKFVFPFELVKTWHVGTRQTKRSAMMLPIFPVLIRRQQGIAQLVKSAFVMVDVLGPHVQNEHFDMIGPDGDIILPLTWAARIRPGMAISMQMYDSRLSTFFRADHLSHMNLGGRSTKRRLDHRSCRPACAFLPLGPTSSRQCQFLTHQARRLVLLYTQNTSCLGTVQNLRLGRRRRRP